MSDKVEERDGFRYVRMPSGDLLSFLGALGYAQGALTRFSRATARCMNLAHAHGEYRGDDLERIEWLLDDVESYVSHVRAELDKARGTQRMEERIALLRNTTGRTPAEAAAFTRKADQLERRMKGTHDN